MKKKLFFLLSSMNVGGVEKAFLGLLTAIPRDKYEVHLGLLQMKGGFLESIPQDITIHHIDCYDAPWRIINDPPLPIIKSLFLKGNIIEAFIQLILYIHFKLTQNRYYFYQWILRKEPKLSENFDIAIAFAGPSQAIDYYICQKVDAPVKCGWIHFDVTKFGIDRGMSKQLYKQYQKIFIVSETGKEKFDQLFPMFKDKTEVFYNIVSPEQVREQAKTGSTFSDEFTGKRILTVGRLSPEKGQNIAIQALKLLIDKGYNVKWYFVGDGKLRKECEQLAQQLNIADRVIFLGTQTNPYGYMKDCDIYMQPSRHEGYCITLAEALCFPNPIVATNFTGAEEQLQSRSNGIVTGMSADDIAQAITNAITLNKEEYFNPNTQTGVQKLLSLIP